MFLNRFTRLRGLGRYACLGSGVLKELGRGSKFHNLQKGRSDYLIRVLEDPAIGCQPARVVSHLARDYIAATLEQQAVLCPDFVPKLVLLDSFSDLTDQLFRHKSEGWEFCCNYHDLQHSESFNSEFECLGLLDLAQLEVQYSRLLQTIETQWPGIPVIYLHFPDVLEVRGKFLERARLIREAVARCALKYINIYSFVVSDQIVQRAEVLDPGLEDFPYHYNHATYVEFAKLILAQPVLRKLF